MILGCPRAKQGLCHTKHGGAGGIILWALLTVFLVFIRLYDFEITCCLILTCTFYKFAFERGQYFFSFLFHLFFWYFFFLSDDIDPSDVIKWDILQLQLSVILINLIAFWLSVQDINSHRFIVFLLVFINCHIFWWDYKICNKFPLKYTLYFCFLISTMYRI